MLHAAHVGQPVHAETVPLCHVRNGNLSERFRFGECLEHEPFLLDFDFRTMILTSVQRNLWGVQNQHDNGEQSSGDRAVVQADQLESRKRSAVAADDFQVVETLQGKDHPDGWPACPGTPRAGAV